MAKAVKHNHVITVSDLANLPALLTTAEVAELRRSNIRTVQNAARELGAVRVDGRWMFPCRRVLSDLGLVEG